MKMKKKLQNHKRFPIVNQSDEIRKKSAIICKAHRYNRLWR